MGIPCEWVPFGKSIFQEEEEKRYGRYSQCYFNVPDYGISKWVVAGYLKVDYQKLQSEGMNEEEIIEGCAIFLSHPPPRKKYQKKPSKPLYGQLEPLPAPWRGKGKYSVKPKVGFDDRLVVEFITDERKNKHFWDEGPSLLASSYTKKVKNKKEKKND